MLTGRPENLPAKKALTLPTLKTTLPVKKSAVGIITLHTPVREEVRKFETSVYYTKTPRMTWIGPNGLPRVRNNS